MIPMSHELKNKIINYIKSGVDISDLIKGIDLKNVDLANAVISQFDVHEQNISGCNLTNTKIINANLAHTIAHNVSFSYANLTNANCTYMDALGSNFVHAICINTNFSCADLRGIDFGGVTLTVSPRTLYHTKISGNILNVLDIKNITFFSMFG